MLLKLDEKGKTEGEAAKPLSVKKTSSTLFKNIMKKKEKLVEKKRFWLTVNQN
jgi:hypothetical protein